MTSNILDEPGISKRMKMLCSNCQWLEFNYDNCRESRKGFECSKYQVKQDINQMREQDPSLNNPGRWLEGNTTKPIL